MPWIDPGERREPPAFGPAESPFARRQPFSIADWEVHRRVVDVWQSEDNCATHFLAGHRPSQISPGPINPLAQLESAIQESRHILALRIDPEDESSDKYAQETWNRATGFLRNHARALWETLGEVMRPPEILPGPDRSIDIHWDRDDYEILINIPASGDEAGFYGDDRGKTRFKGTLDPSRVNEGLLLWLRTKS